MDIRRIESFLKERLSESLDAESFKTWIEPICVEEVHQKKITLSVPNSFFRDWVLENYSSTIKNVLFDIMGQDVSVEYTVKKQSEQRDNRRFLYEEKRPTGIFNPKYTFDNFVVGANNQFANAAALAVATNPGKTYNPLFIYGGVGLGKTHLLNAIGNFVIKHGTIEPDKVCYITAEVFTNELINSLRYQKMDEFRNRFRKMSILLIDDIQFIAGKERTQEEFFHTFNALYEGMKQIVVTSDKFPRDLENIEERLKSRFEWGLIADIQPPDIETKVAILKKKAEEENIDLPLDVAFYIASHTDDSVRSLEGCLKRLSLYASLHNAEITLELAKTVMSGFLKKKDRPVSVETIIREVAKYFSIRPQDLLSKKRARSVLLPRQIALYLARKHTDHSLIDLGQKFGGKDHATVIHAIKKIKQELDFNKELKTAVENIERNLKER
ncbi:MAG: chromosomal replication initiator protein DnaA [Desulfobacterota bacterium]|nr:chromosomal replication initiator protein DnaA [Thermodesulfobacteriota bacterium]MDW8001666.1 chromosomal replication initiator protein DnaA [Deltaproteobacteria bacterium]